MGPIWGRQDPGRPHGGPMNFAIWVCSQLHHATTVFFCSYDLAKYSVKPCQKDFLMVAFLDHDMSVVLHYPSAMKPEEYCRCLHPSVSPSVSPSVRTTKLVCAITQEIFCKSIWNLTDRNILCVNMSVWSWVYPSSLMITHVTVIILSHIIFHFASVILIHDFHMPSAQTRIRNVRIHCNRKISNLCTLAVSFSINND